jgi:hypothetical protein
MVLFDGQQNPEKLESYVSIILLFSGMILARIGEQWAMRDCCGM